ncbi:MAG: sulfotransferase [Desulfovibrionaceae bacterium]
MALTGDRPVFIVGYERSGTTLLMMLLGNHPHLAFPEVGWLYPRIYPWRHTYGDLSVDSHFRTLCAEMLFGLNKPLWGMDLNPATAVEEICAMAPERSFAGIYAAMHRRFLGQFPGKRRWGQKTPNNLYFVPQIRQCFPDAQFLCITRDGRDASAISLDSAFGAGHVYMAAHTWDAAQRFVRPFREAYDADTWHDVSYEELVTRPEETLRRVCTFLGEEYAPGMLDFHATPMAQARGRQRDHALLGSPVSTAHLGIHKRLLSLREQGIYAAVAGETHLALGYELDVEPLEFSEAERELWIEWDGRIRAARLDGPGGHIVFESYRDWLVDRREARRKQGIWSEKDDPREFPSGHPDEEIIVGFRASRRFKDHFCIKRRYA